MTTLIGVERPRRGIDRIADLPVLRLSCQDFWSLPEYSSSLPTGVVDKKRWRRHDGLFDPKCPLRSRAWMVGEYKVTDTHRDGTLSYQKLWYRPVLFQRAVRVPSWREVLIQQIKDLHRDTTAQLLRDNSVQPDDALLKDKLLTLAWDVVKAQRVRPVVSIGYSYRGGAQFPYHSTTLRHEHKLNFIAAAGQLEWDSITLALLGYKPKAN